MRPLPSLIPQGPDKSRDFIIYIIGLSRCWHIIRQVLVITFQLSKNGDIRLAGIIEMKFSSITERHLALIFRKNLFTGFLETDKGYKKVSNRPMIS